MDLMRITLTAWLEAPPLLPPLWLMQAGWRLCWALLLAAGVVWVSTRWLATERARMVVALGVMLWTLWPGPASPAHWLGLAFQSPSLTSSVLCAVGLWQSVRGPRFANVATRSPGQLRGALLGVLLGWLLLGDTLAWWLPSVYDWGFRSVALVVALVLLWGVGVGLRNSAQTRRLRWMLGFVLALFVVTRLPNGNLWDALLDPWLWLVLHWWLLRDLWRRMRRQ